ncbi:hypothetical protein BCR35DRAFT_299032 [Leucosporidium creatinivorum]|uniref:Uncharacterized protein n=1 Tax=Leucosporidium creatinivorum TaxID=106004 RepID=A0A1Y2G6V6_9BASI|nr:hypothetical protein BCR35DRAFT_299032 [Leucosporidium creatinivorum]
MPSPLNLRQRIRDRRAVASPSSRRGSLTLAPPPASPHHHEEFGFNEHRPSSPESPRVVAYTAAMVHHQELVDGFLAKAYPRSPNAFPRNERWQTSVHHVSVMSGYSGGRKAERLDTGISGPTLFARGDGVWLSGGQSMSGDDQRGSRLWASSPGIEPSRVEVQTRNTSSEWHYRRKIRAPIITYYDHGDQPENSFHESPSHLSLWECVEIGRAGSAPASVWVFFILDPPSIRKEMRLREEPSSTYYPPASFAVNSVHVALVRALLTFVDADHIPPRHWDLRWEPKERYLEVFGADVMQRSWIQMMDTLFYGLPEERNRADGTEEEARLTVSWHDGSGSHEAHVLVKHVSELKECDNTSNLVIRTVWRVLDRSAIPASIHIPSQIRFLNHP